ncbi:MAG: sensor histidine kinase, partial [Caulobacteraceae bacterium]
MTLAFPVRRRLHSPLALQIVGLLLAGLVVAQVATLCLTLLLPPKAAPQYRLDDIAAALKGGGLHPQGLRPLVRTIRATPPSLHSAGWLVSEQSQLGLAKLVGADPADVRLLFYSPLPFA